MIEIQYILNEVVIGARDIAMDNENEAGNGWDSGIKVWRESDFVVIRNNDIYENWGEGIAVTRGKDVVVEGNKICDNYSNNVYIDNSIRVNVSDNFSYCTDDSPVLKICLTILPSTVLEDFTLLKQK